MTETKLTEAIRKLQEAYNLDRCFMAQKTRALREVGMYSLADDIEFNCDLVTSLIHQAEDLLHSDINDAMNAQAEQFNGVIRAVSKK